MEVGMEVGMEPRVSFLLQEGQCLIDEQQFWCDVSRK